MFFRNLHYAWIIVFAGTLTLLSCLGLGRFALGMLLPSMGESLELTYTQMGIISTGNFIGYLLAVLICGRIIRRVGERRSIFIGLLLVGSTMLGVSQSNTFLVILLLYCLTGIGSGLANITVMTLVAHWFSARYRGQAAGYMIIGNGMGIVCSGILIPMFNQVDPINGWSTGWLLFGIIVLAVSLIALSLVRNHPKDIQLSPFGDTQSTQSELNSYSPLTAYHKKKLIGLLGVLYFLFGFTYVIYATFIVTSMVEDYQLPERLAGNFWIIIGILSMFSGTLFGWVSDRYGRRRGMIIVFAFQTASYLLAAFSTQQLALLISMALFGLSAFSIPAIIAATISDQLPAAEAASVFGIVTFFFGIGQITGPTIAGVIAEYSGNFTSSYALAAMLTFIAALLSFRVQARKP